MKIFILLFLPLVSSLVCPNCKDAHRLEGCHHHTCKNWEFCEIKEGHHSIPDGTCHHSDKLNENCLNGFCFDKTSPYCYCCTTSDCVKNVTDKHVSPKQGISNTHTLECPSCKDAHGVADCHQRQCKSDEFCEIKEGNNFLPEGTCEHLHDFNKRCPTGACNDHHSPYCYCCTTSDCVRSAMNKNVSPIQVSVMNDHGFSCYKCMGATSLDQCQTVKCHSNEHCVLRVNGDAKLQSSCEPHRACKHQNCHGHNGFLDGVHCEHCCNEEHCVQTTLREILPKLTTTCPICSMATDPSQCFQNMQRCGGLNEKYCKLTTNGHHFSSQCVTPTDCTARLPKFGAGCEENGVDVDCVHCCNDHKCFQLAFGNYMGNTATTSAASTTTAMPTTKIPTTEATTSTVAVTTTMMTATATIPTGCFDTHQIPCQQIFCADPDFSRLYCRKTCSHCTMSTIAISNTTTRPVTTQTSKLTPTATQPTTTATSKQITTPVTTPTAKITTTATHLPTTTAAATPRTTTVHSSGVKHHECFQCGDKASSTYCSGLELVLPPLKPCPAHKPYCVTDIFVVGDGTYETIRRCANRDRCIKDWWEGTSDRSTCVDADPTTLSVKQTCTYCCTKDGCNKDKVPDKTTFFKP